MNYITKLRKKPKHVRDNIAFVAAGVATLPVVAYLVFAVHGPKVTSGITETNETDMKFFETFTTQIKEQVAGVKNAIATSSDETKKYPSTVDRGPLDAVPVVPQDREVSTTLSASTTTSTNIVRGAESR